MDKDIVLRDLEGHDELEACVELQRATWGATFSELIPIVMLKIAQRLGGVVAGAFADDELIGFVYGVTGWVDGKPVHWSDMLAVRPAFQGSGVGIRLKWYQRAVLLQRYVATMHWTFDPLQSKNAYINLVKLGAFSGEYVRDMYGQTDSPLHTGIGTDRLVITWPLDRPDVAARAEGEARARPLAAAADGAASSIDVSVSVVGGLPQPGPARVDLEGPVIGVAVPDSIDELKAASMELAAAWRRETRAALECYLERGYVVRDFVRRDHHSVYLLGSG